MAFPQIYLDTTVAHATWSVHVPTKSTVDPIVPPPSPFLSHPRDVQQDPYNTLSSVFASRNKSAEFWWRTTGTTFAQMLQRAFYPLHQQYRYLVFFYFIILPELGPSPSLDIPPSIQSLLQHHGDNFSTPSLSSSSSTSEDSDVCTEVTPPFLSYMTDDHSPIELSWQFDKEGNAVVRFAIDPVKRQVEGDPRGTMGLFEDLAQMKVLASGVDLEWCRVCADTLTLSTAPSPRAGAGAPEYPSQYFVGFDFSSAGIVMKAYFLPETRAALTATSKATLITNCITKLSTPSSSCPSPPDLLTPWRHVLNFFDSLPADLAPEMNIVAVDCVPSGQNRVKIYVRTPRATLSNLRRFMTLGRDPASTAPSTQRALAQITLMWHLLFPELSSPDCDDVEAVANVPGHPTGGLLWYYELRGGHAEPFPKVYLPVRHLCRSDEQVVGAVETFYREVGNLKAAERYARDVKETFTHRSLSSRPGIHTYITFAAKQHEVEITSYFNPECYAPERVTPPEGRAHRIQSRHRSGRSIGGGITQKSTMNEL